MKDIIKYVVANTCINARTNTFESDGVEKVFDTKREAKAFFNELKRNIKLGNVSKSSTQNKDAVILYLVLFEDEEDFNNNLSHYTEFVESYPKLR